MEGYIKLHRKIRNNEIFNSPQLLRLWLICLTEATHKARIQMVGKQKIELKPGQFITGRYDILEMYNFGLKPSDKVKGEKTVMRWLETLESMEFVTIKKTTKYSLVTVDKWGFYQIGEVEDFQKRPSNDHQIPEKTPNFDHQNDHQNETQEPSGSKGSKVKSKKKTNDHDQQNDHQMTIKSEKNDHKQECLKNKDLKELSLSKFSTTDMENAKLLYELMLINNPTARQPNFEKWADIFRLIRERDKQKDSTVKHLIHWTQNDSFWKMNILSPASLRSKWDQLYLKAKADYEKKQRPTKQNNSKVDFDALRERYKQNGQVGNSELNAASNDVFPKLEMRGSGANG